MRSILLASFLYFLLIFLIGFLLGTIRTIWILPYTGQFLAVLFEIPFMLFFSWKISFRIRNQFRFADDAWAHFFFGISAFGFLFATETLFSIYIFGLTWENYLQNLKLPAGLLGLAAQIAFGLIPVCQVFINNHLLVRNDS